MTRRRRRRQARAWIDEVYEAHGSEVYGFAIRLLRDRGVAEEVTQDTFVRAWRARDRYDPARSSLRTWLFSIARNAAIDVMRARRVRPSFPLAGDVVLASIDELPTVDRLIEAWQIGDALDTLSAAHRTALVEVHIRDRPYAEVAAELGIPLGTLKTRVHHGLRALRDELERLDREREEVR